MTIRVPRGPAYAFTQAEAETLRIIGRDELDAIRARAEAASPGPWRPCAHLRPEPVECTCGYRGGIWRGDGEAVGSDPAEDPSVGLPSTSKAQQHADAQFIVHARADVPALLAEVERLRGEAAEMWPRWHAETEHGLAGNDDNRTCSTCGDENPYRSTP